MTKTARLLAGVSFVALMAAPAAAQTFPGQIPPYSVLANPGSSKAIPAPFVLPSAVIAALANPLDGTGGLASHAALLGAIPSATTCQPYGGSGAAGVVQPMTLGSGLTCASGTVSAINSGGNCPVIPGLVAGGSTDNTSALNAALTALSGASGCLSFPAGKYKFASPISYSLSSGQRVTIEGVGSGATTLYWPSTGGGVSITWPDQTASLHVNGMSLTCGTTNCGNSLALSNSNEIQNYTSEQNIIYDVSCHGDDGILQTDYWSNCVIATSVNAIKFDSVLAYGPSSNAGNGVSLSGYNVSGITNASTATSSAVLNFASTPIGIVADMFVYDLTTPAALSGSRQVSSKTGTTVILTGDPAATVNSGDTIIFTNAQIISNFNNVNFTGLANGIVINTGVQGVTVSGGSNLTDNTQGIFVPPNQVGIVQLNVANSQLGPTQAGQISIATLSGVSDLNVNGNTIFTDDSTGSFPSIDLFVYGQFTISNNNFVRISSSIGTSVGIYVDTPGAGLSAVGTITGNVFSSLYYGCALGAASEGINVQSNAYNGVTTKCSNGGTGNTIGGGSS